MSVKIINKSVRPVEAGFLKAGDSFRIGDSIFLMLSDENKPVYVTHDLVKRAVLLETGRVVHFTPETPIIPVGLEIHVTP